MVAENSVFRIMVADDHALVRGGLVQLVKLVEESVEIIESTDFNQTLEYLANDQEIDLLLLDLMMPGMSGMDSIKQICEEHPDVPLIVVSVRENIASIRNALAAGAVGYIPKTSSPDVMMSAIKLVLSGGVYVPPHVLGLTSATEDTLKDQVIDEGIDNSRGYSMLTKRQQEVLDLMALGKSNKEIADELGLTTGTVKMHSSRIFKTLNVQNRTEAVARFAKS
ncbi:MAG: response regulator transcription factor [Gammaproteobacteria bacterium]|nr:response regulator transcription factor [Gammaproteobacteria bacterium]